MASQLGDIGIFLPSETQYSNPGMYDELVRGEAQKRAAYLASMDQFYAELEQAQQQFEAQLGFQTETRDMELELERERMAMESDLKNRELDLKNKEINSAYRAQTAKDQDLVDFMTSYSDKRLSMAQDQFDTLTGGGDKRFTFIDNYGIYGSAMEQNQAAQDRQDSLDIFSSFTQQSSDDDLLTRVDNQLNNFFGSVG